MESTVTQLLDNNTNCRLRLLKYNKANWQEYKKTSQHITIIKKTLEH